MTIKSKINTKAFEENFGKINWSEGVEFIEPKAGPLHKVCVACNGKGWIDEQMYMCTKCNGTGLGEEIK